MSLQQKLEAEISNTQQKQVEYTYYIYIPYTYIFCIYSVYTWLDHIKPAGAIMLDIKCVCMHVYKSIKLCIITVL